MDSAVLDSAALDSPALDSPALDHAALDKAAHDNAARCDRVAAVVRDSLARATDPSDLCRLVDVTIRRMVEEREVVLVTVSFSPEVPFGEVAIVLRRVGALVREIVPDADRIAVEPHVAIPVRAQQPATETIVLASSD